MTSDLPAAILARLDELRVPGEDPAKDAALRAVVGRINSLLGELDLQDGCGTKILRAIADALGVTDE